MWFGNPLTKEKNKMKPKQINEELLDLCKRLEIKVRKETGSFKSGYCIVNDKKMIILNKTTPPETTNILLAQAITFYGADDVFIKPALREYIENESTEGKIKEEFKIEIDMD